MAGSGFRSVALIFVCAVPLRAVDQVDRNPEVVTVDIAVLKAEIQKILDENRIPGASVALLDKDRTIWVGGVGKADVAAGVDVTADHLFRVGSISKSFTALAALRAVESGLLDLQTPVREVAPEVGFTNRWDGTHPITVAMLLEHTAGFDDLHFLERAVDDPEITLAEGLACHPHSRVRRWKPGTYTSYSNSGPPAAAYVLEKITAQDFEDYVREQVFDPLGMESSTFRYSRDAALMAKGYEADGVTEANYSHTIFRPYGGLITSSREMARYLRVMINRDTLDGVRLLASETITRMETPTTTLAARAGFTDGRGLGNSTSIVNGHLFHGHNGGGPGFVSRSWYSSDLGVGFFVSINNRSGRIDDIAQLLGERLTEGFEKPQVAVAALSDDELRAMTGYYQNVTPRQQIEYAVRRFVAIRRVTLVEGTLFIAPPVGGEKQELVPVTARSFRYEDEPLASVFQVVDDDGNPVLQVGRNANYKRVGAAWLFFQWAVAATTAVAVDLSPALRARVAARQDLRPDEEDPSPDGALSAAGHPLDRRLVPPARSDASDRHRPGHGHHFGGVSQLLHRFAGVRGSDGAEPPCFVSLVLRRDRPVRPAAQQACEPSLHCRIALLLEQRMDRAQDVGVLRRSLPRLQPPPGIGLATPDREQLRHRGAGVSMGRPA